MNKTYELICQYINWMPTTNIDTMKLNLSQDFSREDLKEAESYANDLYARLREAGIERMIGEANGYYGDSVHDCMSELVAHGEEYVDYIIKNPTLAVGRLVEGEYTENFFYVFPYEDDYDKDGNFELLTPKYYYRRVCEIKKYLQDTLHGTPEEGVTRLGSNGRIEDVMTHEDVKYLAEVLDEIWHLKWNSNRDYKTIEKHTQGLGHGWAVCNLWSDMGKYYAKMNNECVIGDGKFRRVPDGVDEY